MPFSEPFTLTAVAGAEIAHGRAEPLEASVVARPSFSRAPGEDETSAPTVQAPPVFEPFKLGTMLTDQRSKPAAKR